MSRATDAACPDACAGRTARERRAAWAARLAYAFVFVINMQCALGYVLHPDAFLAAYGLEGVPGTVAVQGLGVAFMMWNATYPAVIANPRRFGALAVVVLVQQVVGLVGETAILLGMPGGYPSLSASIVRFIAFDAGGLVLMAAALCWMSLARRHADCPVA